MQPIQQHGRRLPSASSMGARAIRRARVSACLASCIQHSHSLRAKGVISLQVARAFLFASKAFLKAAGKVVCTVPVGIVLVGMPLFYYESANGKPAKFTAL